MVDLSPCGSSSGRRRAAVVVSILLPCMTFAAVAELIGPPALAGSVGMVERRAGLGAGGMAVLGLYRVILECRLWLATLTMLAYVPVLVVASLCTYSLLLFCAPI
jgi:hypothetical protein